MDENIDRPFDFLNQLKGSKISLDLKGRDTSIEGKLLAFDIHINLVIETKEGLKFIRGDVIETISPGN